MKLARAWGREELSFALKAFQINTRDSREKMTKFHYIHMCENPAYMSQRRHAGEVRGQKGKMRCIQDILSQGRGEAPWGFQR